MNADTLFEVQWEPLIACLGDLDESARASGALKRRRGVQSAEVLLRLALVYAHTNKSLRETAAWAEATGVASLSDVALLKRFRTCGPWLGELVCRKIAERAQWSSPETSGLRLRLFDASSLSLPGSKGTDRRIHLGLDLQSLRIDHVEVTGADQGESLERFNLKPGELGIGDRGYAHRAALYQAHVAGGQFLVRLPWKNVPLETATGKSFDIITYARSLNGTTPSATEVFLREKKKPPIALRLIAIRKSESAAEHTREKIHRLARKQGRTNAVQTLEAAGYVFLITNTNFSATKLLELYRLRWQVEMAFKRLKSLLHLDQIAAKEDRIVETYVLAKLLAALLIEDLTTRYVDFFPWGYPIRPLPDNLATHPDLPRVHH